MTIYLLELGKNQVRQGRMMVNLFGFDVFGNMGLGIRRIKCYDDGI